MAPNISLKIFIKHFLQPIADKSNLLHDRDLIKACMPLNKSLHENRGGINWIFNKLKGDNNMIEKTVITDYMSDILSTRPDFDLVQLHPIFVYSLQIIHNDLSDTSKYCFLTYSEFIEYICRIANKLFKDRKGEIESRLERKAVDFIKIMYEHEGIFDPVQAKVKSPEEDISF